MSNIPYDTLQHYRKVAEVAAQGASVTMDPHELLALLNMIKGLQNEVGVLMEDKEDLIGDLSRARESSNTTTEQAIAQRDRLRDGYDYPPGASVMCPGCTQKNGRVERMCRLHDEIKGLRLELAECRHQHDTRDKLDEVTENVLAFASQTSSMLAKERDDAKVKLSDAQLDRTMLQETCNWQRWLLETQEEEAAAVLVRAVSAWESLPGGQRHSPRAIESWLVDNMGPAIDAIRHFLDRNTL